MKYASGGICRWGGQTKGLNFEMQKIGWVLAFEDNSSSYAAGPMTSNHVMRSIYAP